ncbi:hypothetical protein QK3_0228 [Clostridioides difficile DA00145]|nr:hypothetical protein QK3_0228 [Clostridioides difficile DA00145]
MIELDGIDMENKMLAILHKDKNITQPLKIILDNISNVL